MSESYRVDIGGLFRCCTLSLDETMETRKQQSLPLSVEGEKLSCLYCKKETMVVKDGVWEWIGNEELRSKGYLK